MDYCRVCGQPSMVMNAYYTKKVPFEMGPGATSFICGLCVAYGALKPRVKEPEDKHFDLKLWRKANKLTQEQLAESLMISRVQVSKVESGERILPARWRPILEKMYPTHV